MIAAVVVLRYRFGVGAFFAFADNIQKALRTKNIDGAQQLLQQV